MNPSNPLQTQPEIGNDYYRKPLQSVQMPIIKRNNLLCSPLTPLLNQYLTMLHRHWRINILRN
jgi:hypothetical protein